MIVVAMVFLMMESYNEWDPVNFFFCLFLSLLFVAMIITAVEFTINVTTRPKRSQGNCFICTAINLLCLINDNNHDNELIAMRLSLIVP